MNRYKLNISSNSIMLLRTYDPTQSTHKNNSNDSIKSINQLNLYVDLFWKTFDFVDLFEFFESIEFIQSHQSLKINRLNHPLYENELTQSPINSPGKGTESIQSILWKRWIDSNQSTQSSWLVYKYGSDPRHGAGYCDAAMATWSASFFNSKSETSLTDVVCELCFEMVGNESILVPLT